MVRTLLEFLAETGIGKRSIHKVLREDLRLRKTATEVDMQYVIYYL